MNNTGSTHHPAKMHPITVLITRPDPDGKALCEILSGLGIRTVHQPLIEFRQGKDCHLLHSKIKSADFVIAVSKAAVEWADKILQLSTQSWPDSACYLAVGQKTAHKLSKVSAQKVHYPDISDSEHLLQLSPLLNPENATVTILRGNGGRELIRDTLLKRGANVEYCEVYQRKMLPFNGSSEVKRWQKSRISHIVLTSGEQLEHFFSMIPESDHNWLFEKTLIVPSRRVASLAHKLGFHNIIVSGSASTPDIAAVIQQQCITG